MVTNPRDAQTAPEAALIEIVEGIKGAMDHGTWRDEKGMRLKDTPEWVAFYNTVRADTPARAGMGAVRRFRIDHNGAIERPDGMWCLYDEAAALQPGEAQGAEPVAWQQRLSSGGWGTILHGNDKPIGEARPLYANPPAAQVTVTDAVQEWADAKDDLRQFEDENPSNTASTWEAKRQSVECAEDRLRAALRALAGEA